MEARYKKACVGYARIREIIIQKKIEAGDKNPVVTRLEAWEYARKNADGVVTDPITLEVLKEAALTQELPEHELGTDDLLARLIPKEYSGRVRAVGWGVTKKSLHSTSTMSELSKLKNDVAYLINEIKELKSKGCNPGMQSGGSSEMDNFDMDNEIGREQDVDLPEGKNACYLYLDPGRKYVGRGILHNDLNDRVLHGIPLEEGYVRVQFEVAEKSEFNTPLPRPCDEANVVGEAPGYFLAWPRKFVSMELETPPRTMDKEKGRPAKGHKKLEDKENKKLVDKEKEKTRESVVGMSSRQLGYPLPGDVCDDGVLEFVRLAVVFDRVTDIVVDMGPYWDLDPWTEHINKENVLEVLDAQWLSASSLVFYIRYLCEVYLSNNPESAAKFSFVSPHIVSHLVDSSNTSLAKCLLGHVDKDHLIIVPYNVSKHWILVAINTKTENIYFMDPAPMTSAINLKNVKGLVETAMSMFRTHNRKNYSMTSFNNFRWLNIQCPKQDDGMSCGYYVGCFIEDILCTGETKINVNFTYTPRLKTYPREKILGFKKNWAGYLYNRFLKGNLLMK